MIELIALIFFIILVLSVMASVIVAISVYGAHKQNTSIKAAILIVQEVEGIHDAFMRLRISMAANDMCDTIYAPLIISAHWTTSHLPLTRKLTQEEMANMAGYYRQVQTLDVLRQEIVLELRSKQEINKDSMCFLAFHRALMQYQSLIGTDTYLKLEKLAKMKFEKEEYRF